MASSTVRESETEQHNAMHSSSTLSLAGSFPWPVPVFLSLSLCEEEVKLKNRITENGTGLGADTASQHQFCLSLKYKHLTAYTDRLYEVNMLIGKHAPGGA